MANWLLAFSQRHLSISVAASDSDQAKILMEAMDSEARHNPWLSSRVKHHQKTAKGPGGKLTVLTADAGSSFGRNDDVTIIDEITHWNKPDLFEVLYSGSKKRPGSVVVIITNAGVIGSWQWRQWKRAHQETSWDVFDAPGPLASWMTPEGIAEIRRGLPRGLARRVLDNMWIDPAEEADFLTRAEIEVCPRKGMEAGLTFQTRGRPGLRYVLSVDYGPKRDRTALCVGHRDTSKGYVIVDRLEVWQGSPSEPIQVQRVEAWLREMWKLFPGAVLVIDPYQMEGTAQDFEVGHRVERFEARGGKSNYEMAENFRSLIVSGQLLWYPGAGDILVDGVMETLVDEIAGLVIKATPYGYRFDHTSSFHDDKAVAVGMMALIACRLDPSGPGAPPPPVKVQKNPILIQDLKPTWERRGLWGVRR